jgi:hypothetical protein
VPQLELNRAWHRLSWHRLSSHLQAQAFPRGTELDACRSSHAPPYRMGSAWDPHGIRMGSAWDPHGIRMGSAWDPHGIRMGSAWDPHRMGSARDPLLDPDGFRKMGCLDAVLCGCASLSCTAVSVAAPLWQVREELSQTQPEHQFQCMHHAKEGRGAVGPYQNLDRCVMDCTARRTTRHTPRHTTHPTTRHTTRHARASHDPSHDPSHAHPGSLETLPTSLRSKSYYVVPF